MVPSAAAPHSPNVSDFIDKPDIAITIQVIGPGKWLSGMWRKHKIGTIAACLLLGVAGLATWQSYWKGSRLPPLEPQPVFTEPTPQVAVAPEPPPKPPVSKSTVKGIGHSIEEVNRVIVKSGTWQWLPNQQLEYEDGTVSWQAYHLIHKEEVLSAEGPKRDIARLLIYVGSKGDANLLIEKLIDASRILGELSAWNEFTIRGWILEVTKEPGWDRRVHTIQRINNTLSLQVVNRPPLGEIMVFVLTGN